MPGRRTLTATACPSSRARWTWASGVTATGASRSSASSTLRGASPHASFSVFSTTFARSGVASSCRPFAAAVGQLAQRRGQRLGRDDAARACEQQPSGRRVPQQAAADLARPCAARAGRRRSGRRRPRTVQRRRPTTSPCVTSPQSRHGCAVVPWRAGRHRCPMSAASRELCRVRSPEGSELDKASDLEVASRAGEQWGVLSLLELRECGLNRKAVAVRVRSGRLHRLHRGVYAVGHANPPREGRWPAAVKACGGRRGPEPASRAGGRWWETPRGGDERHPGG